MSRILLIAGLLLSSVPGLALAHPDEMVQLTDAGQFPVTLSQAVVIAQQTVPGATVLSVKLLSNGYYAVTLRHGGNVVRVMVDATTGAVS